MAAYEFNITEKDATVANKADVSALHGRAVNSHNLKPFLLDQSGPTLVRLFNNVRASDVPEVRKFSDKRTAVRRLIEALEAMPMTAKKKEKTKKVQMITLNSEIDPELKLPRQAMDIIACLQDLNADNEPVSRETLVEGMKAHVVSNQPLDRIFSFYKTKLVNSGCIIVTKESM